MLLHLVEVGVEWISKRKIIRRVRADLSRGRTCFQIPNGKTYILVPERADSRGGHYIERDDEAATKCVTEMFRKFGYREGKDWEVLTLPLGRTVPDHVRRENLITICGPVANPFVKELFADNPYLLRAEFTSSERRGFRRFRWNNRVYKTAQDHDFAYFGIRKNPYNPERRLIILFGLRGIGTMGAATLYASGDRRRRVSVEKECGTLGGELDMVLFVKHDEKNQITEIRQAKVEDAIPSNAYVSVNERLNEVAAAVEAFHRKIKISKLEYTFTVNPDFSLRSVEEVTIGAAETDIFIFYKPYEATTPTKHIEDLNFTIDTVDNSPNERAVSLPVKDDLLEKSFLVFAIPPIVRNGTARRFRFSVVWPGGAEVLSSVHGRDVFSVEVSNKAAEKVDSVTIRVRFETPGSVFTVGRLQDGANTDPRPAKECRVNEPFEISFEDVPPGSHYNIQIVRKA